MSEMIRRVATVIAKNDDHCSGERVPCVTDPPGSPDECQCMRTARAAIAKMREPTEAMLTRAESNSDNCIIDHYGRALYESTAQAWIDMIAAALAD